MPLYEYQCDACAHRFEVIHKFSDPPVATCPSCGGSVARLPSSPAIQFRGSGFYITDYARAGQKDPGKSETKDSGGAGSEGTATPKAEGKGDTKTENKTKPDAKSEAKADGKPAAKIESKSNASTSKSE